MRALIETGVVIGACGSAAFWFASAMCRLPSRFPGPDELAKADELSKALQKMNRRNFWAAGLMGIAALLSVWARLLG